MKIVHTWRVRALAVCLVASCGSQLLWAQTAPAPVQQPPAAPVQQPPAAPVQQPPAAPVQQPPAAAKPTPQTPAPPATPAGAPQPALPKQETPLPAGYVIGPDDVLLVSYWRNADMSAEVTVRPDGLISLPLLNEIQAGGLTPEQLRDRISKASTKYLEDAPTLAIVVKTINSRKVYVTGMVAKPGFYQLTGAMTVVQLLATAGGIQEFSDSKNIRIVRNEGGKQIAFTFNWKDFVKGKNLNQNIELKPGDTIVVP